MAHDPALEFAAGLASLGMDPKEAADYARNSTRASLIVGESQWDFDALLLLIDAELEGVDIQNTDRRGKLLHAARVNIRNWRARP